MREVRYGDVVSYYLSFELERETVPRRYWAFLVVRAALKRRLL